MERKRVRAVGNDLVERAELSAYIAVQVMQTGKGSPDYYLERAAHLRAEAYEYHATADIIRPLQDARWETEHRSGYGGH